MPRPFLLCLAVGAFACAPAEPRPGEEPPAAALSLDAFAGQWTVTGLAHDSDSVLIRNALHATSTTEGWTTTIPGRDPLPVRVTLVEGDSVVVKAGPFESALRPGASVTTRSAVRRQGAPGAPCTRGRPSG